MARLEVTADTVNVRSGPGVGYEVLSTLDKGREVEEISTEGWCPVEMDDNSIAWISRKYLSAVAEDQTAPAPPAQAVAGGEPPWITWARGKLGVKEAPGGEDNPEIITWDKLMQTLPRSMDHDSTPWCAIFVHAAFHFSGYPESLDIDSAAAVDWLKFGKPVDEPKKGDVVVFEWEGGGHHVCFFLKDLGDGEIQCIGGNQSDAVTIANFPADAVMGYRRAA